MVSATIALLSFLLVSSIWSTWEWLQFRFYYYSSYFIITIQTLLLQFRLHYYNSDFISNLCNYLITLYGLHRHDVPIISAGLLTTGGS